MAAWNSLSVEEQERVIGRTKLDDIELDDAVKPANSHIALNVIEDRNMFIGDPPGNTDRILEFSTALTGGLFSAPTLDFLDDSPPPPNSAVAGPAEHPGSRGIGSLKGIR